MVAAAVAPAACGNGGEWWHLFAVCVWSVARLIVFIHVLSGYSHERSVLLSSTTSLGDGFMHVCVE